MQVNQKLNWAPTLKSSPVMLSGKKSVFCKAIKTAYTRGHILHVFTLFCLCQYHIHKNLYIYSFFEVGIKQIVNSNRWQIKICRIRVKSNFLYRHIKFLHQSITQDSYPVKWGLYFFVKLSNLYFREWYLWALWQASP